MSITQALYNQIVEEKPDAGKEEIRALFLAVAMDDREMLQAIVNEMFEVTWTLSKIAAEHAKRAD